MSFLSQSQVMLEFVTTLSITNNTQHSFINVIFKSHNIYNYCNNTHEHHLA